MSPRITDRSQPRTNKATQPPSLESSITSALILYHHHPKLTADMETELELESKLVVDSKLELVPTLEWVPGLVWDFQLVWDSKE
jgi:hypothetical protein